MALESDSSSEDESAPVSSKKSGTRPRPIAGTAASYGTFLAASVNLPLGSKPWMEIRTGFTKYKTVTGAQCIRTMAGMANGCHIHGRPNPSDMAKYQKSKCGGPESSHVHLCTDSECYLRGKHSSENNRTGKHQG
ncbi:hypothetical protein V6N13_044022 [Hibiscus sabdariffa]|uniref:Uncharacterized protein n=1 Tax=Hibiscus sabdariffa TaxID=183260 RepID=A0ABR2RGX8_9ROSI